MPKTPRLALSVTLVALLAAACGGGDDSAGTADDESSTTTTAQAAELTSEEKAYADEFALSLREGSGATFERAEADCMATALMSEIGVGPFEEAGVTPQDVADAPDGADSPGRLLGDGAVTDAQADAILDGWDDCTDVDAAFVANMATELGIEDDEKKLGCVERELRGGDLVREGYRQTLTDSSGEPSGDVLSGLLGVMDVCGISMGGGESTGRILVDSIAESLAAGGHITEDQAQCLAKGIVDQVGQDDLLSGAKKGDFSDAPPELQAKVASAVVSSAEACGIPASALGG